MKFRIFPAAIFLMLVSLGCFAQTITLKEFLDLAKENHPYFNKEKLTVEIEKKESESLLGTKDWMISISPYYDYLDEVSASMYGADKINRFGLSAGLQKSIWATGGSFGLSVSSGYSRSESDSFGTSKAYTHGVGLSYTQPLLQNSGGRLDRLNYDLSAYRITFTEAQILENQEAFILDLAVNFLGWVQLTEEIEIGEERCSLAEEQLKQVQKRYNANLVDKVDVMRGRDSLRAAEQGLLQIKSLWRAKQAELAVIAQSAELYEKSPVFDLYVLEKLPGIEEAVIELKKQSRLLQSFDILKEQLICSRDGLIEQKRPQLDLIVSGSFNGMDEEIGKSLEISKPTASLLLEFSTSPCNRGIESGIEKIDLQIRKLYEEKRDIGINLEVTLRNLLIRIADMGNLLKLNQTRIESAGEKTLEELMMYDQGRSQLAFVIQSRDSEQNARLGYAGNAVLYHILLLQYHAVLDELLAVYVKGE